ncbi:hypothetical protein [Polyangium sp. 15x6]|uniref:hypothetical protein n=1 Tax=Polyangium sp. 15x6 TaxID=3042687 RepID=UPI00249BB7B9|nr:hypothetical protein [Polyangium sp. 15x6]MDI3286752.1 hypothetical protein [Polyangium sp. 15x6]
MANARTRTGSNLLLDEYWEAGDDRYVDEVLSLTAGKKLKSLADRWMKDSRPFARRTLVAYIADGCDRPHHRPLVKSLFKLAEKAHDDELVGHFMVAFDRLVARKLVEKQRYDWSSRQSLKVRTLVGEGKHPTRFWGRNDSAPHFSKATRNYLRRRVLRYFRDIGRKDPVRYGEAIRKALVLYRDDHLDKPEHLLDAWSLLHALYHGSPVLDRHPDGIRVAKDRSLAELEPAPLWPEAWKGSFEGVLALVTTAKSRTVRVFAVEILKAWYPRELGSLTMARLRPLIASPNEEVQVFAADLLRTAEGISSLSVAEWLELLQIDNPTALGFLCEAIKKHVAPARLTLDQCVDLACSPVAPVAELGLDWAMTKKTAGIKGIEAMLRLASARAPRVREAAAKWVVSILSTSKDARMTHVRDLVDARYDDVRREALQLFERDVRFKDDPALWSALAESPYDDVRAFLLAHLVAREKALGPATLERIWATTILAVHRGSKQKRTALSQIAARIVAHPGEAEPLVGLFGYALRSVRPPERRAALAAVSRAAFQAPALRSAIGRKLPELSLFQEERA